MNSPTRVQNALWFLLVISATTSSCFAFSYGSALGGICGQVIALVGAARGRTAILSCIASILTGLGLAGRHQAGPLEVVEPGDTHEDEA